jgi:TPR repeat protein
LTTIRTRLSRLVAIGFAIGVATVCAEPPADSSGLTDSKNGEELKEQWAAPELANESKPDFISQLEKDAAAGKANAQAALGVCYQGAHGVPRDLAKAVHWYELAVQAGHPGAQTNLAQLYEIGAGVQRDHLKAYALYHAAAGQGLAEAQFHAGLHWAYGVGVPQDWTQARSWYARAADQGNLSAMTNLGNIYLRGRGVPENLGAARKYLQKPADAGLAPAQFGLASAYMTEGNYAAAAPWLQRSAEGGDQGGQFYLAVSLYFGKIGSPDPVQALSWARKAAQNVSSTNPTLVSHVHALLARILLDHPGKDTDAEAFREARISAEAGDPEGEFQFGRCYISGMGVAKNVPTGINWYTAAAGKKHPDAAAALGSIYEKGLGVTANLTEALKWYKMAAENGNSTAQFNLARCYRDGVGVEINLDEALRWLRSAAKGAPGNNEIAAALTQLETQTGQVDPDAAFNRGMSMAQTVRRDGGSMDEAVKVLTAAANQGHVPATIILSGWYRRGDHVTKNEARADALIAKVESNTSPAILFQIGLSYMPGVNQMPVEKDIDHALGYLQRAADQGYGLAPGPLGFCYMTASPAHQDFVSAFEWLSVAAGQGDQNAVMYLERLRPRLTNAQTKEALARLNEIRTRSSAAAPAGPGNAASRPAAE